MPDAPPPSDEAIPVAGPWITELEVAYAADAAATNWYDRAGDYVGRFEESFARHVGRQFAVTLPSCTAGIHLALAALDIGPGDEVIVPDLTWIASAAPISYVGATPIFVDVDPVTWCLDVDAVAAALTERTRAVLPVDLYGGMPDMGALEALVDAAGVALVEDAAEAIGAAWGAAAAGSFGRASVFSFHGSKTLVTGEGGMLVTDHESLFDRVQVLRDHGRARGDVTFRNGEVAYKYKMSAVQAAIGLAQLERVHELVGRKREIFAWYHERLGGRDDLALNAEPPGTRNGYWMATIVLDPAVAVSKQELQAALAAESIATRPFFDPLSSLAAYAGAPSAAGAAERNPNAYRVGPRGVNLPSALSLTERQVDRVCRCVADVLDSRH